MIILIPLGGLGTRFSKLGYNLPKPLINVMSKPIISWLIDGLNITKNDLIYIPYNSVLKQYRFEEQLQKKYPNIHFKFLELKENTRGAAETIHIALNELDNIDDDNILCLDGDNFYTCDVVKLWKQKNSVIVFQDTSNEPIYSYVKLNEDQTIDEIKEKEKISDYACTGAYGFDSWITLNKYCKKIIDENIMFKNEFYTSVVIQEMIKDNNSFDISIVNSNDYICLGTPLHVRLFCNNFPRINALNNNTMLPSKRYCFDLDNTLVSFPKIDKDYTSVEPIHENIKMVRYLKKLGHTIIIYSARRMKTHKGNVGKIIADVGKITLDTLEKFEIPYDEIYFGKPEAEYYIDDLAISSYADLEKELGYYNSSISPRDFNSLTSSSLPIYKKVSEDLSGEIYYYNNIPNEIKDMFPILVNYDINNKWYEMEKINGIPVSKLYLSQELSIEQLYHIMGSVQRIHNSKSVLTDDVNIYSNYQKKLQHRYNNYDYSKFENSEEIYNHLYNQLNEYEKQNKGIKKIIHGDTVLTNILINQFGKIKFIDMRGTQEHNLTIFGDWLYDWAKLYQSLIGYDEILENKQLNIEYKNKIVKTFEEKFTSIYSEEDFKNLKMITNSLLFSLIPLHDNEKCYEYYKLINI
jgi:capsule biosynthesis phosphatase